MQPQDSDPEIVESLKKSGDGVLAIRKLLGEASNADVHNSVANVMTTEERDRFSELLAKREEKLFDKVSSWTTYMQSLYDDALLLLNSPEVKSWLEREQMVTVQALFKSDAVESQIAVCEGVIRDLTTLKFEFKAFADQLQSRILEDVKMTAHHQEIQRFTGKITTLAGILGYVAAALCGFGAAPAVIFLAVPAMVSGLVLTWEASGDLTPEENDRAMRFLKDIQTNMADQKSAIMKTNVLTKRLARDDVPSFRKLIEDAKEQIAKVSQLCDDARRE